MTLARGTAEICQVENGDETCVSTTSSTAAWGAVRGFGSLALSGELEGELILGFGGHMRGPTAKPTVRLSLSAEGQVSDGSATIEVQGEGRMKCKLDPIESDRFACKAKLRLCTRANGRRVDCRGLSFPIALATEKASFVVTLGLETDAGGRISGTAEVQVENVDSIQPLELAAKGKCRSASDRSNVGFHWTHGGPSKLSLKEGSFAAGAATGGRLGFKIAGQKGKFELTP